LYSSLEAPDESINKLEMMLAIYEPDLKVLRLDCEPDGRQVYLRANL